MRKGRSLAMACAGLICAAQTAGAQGAANSSATQARPEACADLGSFAVVDPPGGGRGALSAQSYTPCADLDGRRRDDSVQIGVDVMLGGQNSNASQPSPTGGMQPGQTLRRRP
ncbi:hypothetical protein GCM10007036_42850 [Alsobacter metallidurans]|uniref:Uncharacterized protein n=1 Tax=Alsobacter metallidurans TaxID=340221 RepID=A0A917IA20_9HYPH|nr:hypothetical protein [Alsobacter metallidurans]GGH31554.1 hypothetical protein GCM10007036_42850 [Alsobacter metallidurans]